MNDDESNKNDKLWEKTTLSAKGRPITAEMINDLANTVAEVQPLSLDQCIEKMGLRQRVDELIKIYKS